MSRDTGTLVGDVIAAVNARDAEKIAELTHPDVEFHATIAASEGRWYQGREGFVRFFQDVEDAFDAFEIVLLGWEQPRTDVIIVELVMNATGRSSKVPITQPVWQVWSYREGVPWRNQAFFTRAEALAAAGLSE